MIVQSDAGLGVDPNQITSVIGSSLLSASWKVAAINPIAGAAVAVAGILTTVFGGMFGKPDYTKIAATHIVDAVESQVMKPNLAGWMALPPEQKTAENQQAFLNNFNLGWQKVIQGCSDAALQTAGQNCIADRQRGGKWDWFVYYYDPIANDQIYTPPSVSVVDQVSSSVSSLIPSGINMPLVLLGLLGVGLIGWGLE